MIQNYLKRSFRALLKNPLFTALNTLGLALGLTASLLLFLHVRNEWSFDRYHAKADRICRVILNVSREGGDAEQLANAPNSAGPTIKDNIPAVAQYTRLLKHEFGTTAFISAGDKKLVEESLYWADPGFLEIFDVQQVAGDLASALTQPNTVALSRSTAIRYFGTADPVGQVIRVDRMEPLEVKAVYEDFPGNSTFDANLLGSFSSVKWANQKLTWDNASFETWLLLGPGADRLQTEQQIESVLARNIEKGNRWFSIMLQPLRDVHLYSSGMQNNYSARLGDPKQVTILSVLALAVLLIACFNYMNLSTARSQLRFREVGINKTMGASRGQLATRFYVETAVMVGISLLLATGFVALSIPLFNQLADKHLTIRSLFLPQTLLAILGIGVAVSLFAGSYPAFFLSSFSPKSLLQTTFGKETGAGWLRRSLVTVQFAASVVLMTGTVVLYRQMQYIQQKKLGFEPEQVLAITTTAAEDISQVDALMQGCRNLSTVKAVCRAQTYPGGQASGRNLFRPDDLENGRSISTNRVSPGFEKVLGIKMLAGNPLSEKAPGDTVVHVVLNKTAVDYLGYSPEEAIGKKVTCQLGENAVITGVTEDFHSESLHKPINAYAFHDASTESRRFMMVKMSTGNLPETMRRIEGVFRSALPQSAFEYRFLDEHLDSMYRGEQRTARVVLVFSILSILVSCLGLFGLVAFAAEQRTKEIGVRRVLGADVASITGLLTRDFLKLVLIAIVVAIPVAYWAMNAWLADFVYRVEIQWWMFAVASLAAMAIAVMTVGFQSIKAALANPVKSLRSE